MNRLAIIADDHTGAGDSGVHFAAAGKEMALLWDVEGIGESLSTSGGVALSTESRFRDPGAAAEKVRQAIRHCRQAGFDRFFKKIDSTLRGNPGSEIEAALEATGSDAALVCTSVPRLGRTCADGVIRLEGKPLHTTDIGHDPFHPLSTSSISELLARQTDLPIGHLTLEDVRSVAARLSETLTDRMLAGFRIIVADAQVERDLQSLADLLRNMPQVLPVGAGGLAKALAGTISAQVGARRAQPTPAGRMLAVVGSLAEASRVQAEYVCRNGSFRSLDLDVEGDPEREYARVAKEASDCNGTHLLLRPRFGPGPRPPAAAEGERVAAMLGRSADAVCRAVRCDVVFSTGGSTSMAVARAMGIRRIVLEDELLPGVVLGSCAVPAGGPRWFVTKAGGFGDERTLAALADRFRPPAGTGGSR